VGQFERVARARRPVNHALDARATNQGPDRSVLCSTMITFQIAGYLTEFTGGRAEIKLDGSAATVAGALNQLCSKHVGLRDRVLTEQGNVRPHVNLFLNNQIVRRDRVLQTEIAGDAEICIMPAVSGGWLDH